MISLEVDWLYRKGAKLFYCVVDKSLNTLNQVTDKLVVQEGVGHLSKFVTTIPERALYMIVRPYCKLSGLNESEIKDKLTTLNAQYQSGTLPIGASALVVMVVVGIMLII